MTVRPKPLASALATLLVLAALGGLGGPSASASLLPGAREDWNVAFVSLPPGIRVGDEYNGGTVYRVNAALDAIAVTTTDPGFKTRAHSDPNVLYVEPDGTYRLLAAPNDPLYPEQYELAQTRLPDAWNVTMGGAGATLCIIDTGVRHTHEDLRGVRWLGGVDLVNRDDDPWDDQGHGTHVTGIAAASVDNAKGGAGAANVGFRVVKVLDANGAGAWSTVAEGITWCADRSPPNTIISLSLGGGYSQVVHDAARYAYEVKGMLLVAAAGNEGPCTDCVRYPAALPEVIAVTCTAAGETFCPYSSEGPEAELSAPGDAILNACFQHDAHYCERSGTSDSAPLVSGIAALHWASAPALTNVELRAKLQATAQDLGPGGRDPRFGFGEVDAKCLLLNATPCHAPPNDRFEKAERIGALPFARPADTRLATRDANEPQPCGGIGATVWYSWTAPAGGEVTVNAGGGDLDAVVAVHRADLAGPSLLACALKPPKARFQAEQGATYLFQVGGRNGARGLGGIEVTCKGCPDNNAFETPRTLSALPASAAQSTLGGSKQLLEPEPCGPVGATVWYSWVPRVRGTVTLDTFGSRFDTVLAVHTGSSLATLAPVACNNDSDGERQSRVTFAASPGTTYRIQVGGLSGASGELRLTLQCPECLAAPPNDLRASARTIVASAVLEETGTLGATDEADEPRPCGSIGKTVWYSFTPQLDALTILRTAGSDFDTVLAVYVLDGTGLRALACSDDLQGGHDPTSALVLSLRGGVTYLVQAGGFQGDSGLLKLGLRCHTACFTSRGNDMRADALVIPALPYTNGQDNVGYTLEAGERRAPNLGATAWYTYTAPTLSAPRVVSVDTRGSLIDTVVAVFATDSYVLVGHNDNALEGGLTSALKFVAVPGTTYHVAVGGWTDVGFTDQGYVRLNVA